MAPFLNTANVAVRVTLVLLLARYAHLILDLRFLMFHRRVPLNARSATSGTPSASERPFPVFLGVGRDMLYSTLYNINKTFHSSQSYIVRVGSFAPFSVVQVTTNHRRFKIVGSSTRYSSGT